MTGWVTRAPSGRRLLPAAAGALVVALVGLPGCTTEDQPRAASPSSTSPTSSTTATAAAPTPTPTGAGEPGPGARADCTDPQRRAARGLRTWKAIDAVTSSMTGRSRAAARRVRREAAEAAQRVEAACGRVPPPTRRYVDVVRREADVALGGRQLDRVLAAWLRWGTAVGGERPAETEIRELAACRALMRDFTVTHRLWWRWTDTGRAWWVELTWDNRSGRTVSGELFGEVRVTGWLPDRFGWSAAAVRGGPGRTRSEGWGGSSADFAEVRPGVSRQVLAPGADTDVHTTAAGTVTVTDNAVFVYAPGPGLNPCLLPVPERS